MNRNAFIPVNRPYLYPQSRRYVREALKSGWISSEGPFVKRFEEAFADYLGIPYATSTNSGTSALHLALLSLDIGKNDEVILPALTIASCFFAIWYAGAKAVPVDVTSDTLTIDPQLIEAKITKSTKAIMVVHLFGHPCDMDPIVEIARRHNLKIIEDAAEAHGAEYKGVKVGSIGDIGIFSFYANKIVTTGEGGMLVTKEKAYIEKAARIKSLNHSPQTRFIHGGIGYNYLMSNLEAAVGLGSLENIERSISYKRSLADVYAKYLKSIRQLILPEEKSWAKCVYWMYAVRFLGNGTGTEKQELTRRLQERFNIQTRTFFFPPDLAFKSLGKYEHESFPVSSEASAQGFYLPSGIGNTRLEVRYAAQSLKALLTA